MKTHCPHCGSKAVIYAIESSTRQECSVLLQCTDIQNCGARSRYALSVKKALQRSLLPDDKQFTHADGLLSVNFRVNCPHCGFPAIIYSRYNVTRITSDLYCQCSHELCQSRLVIDFAYHATVLPPIKGIEQLALHIVKNAKPKLFSEQQMDLFAVG